MNGASELKALMLAEPRWTLAIAESVTCGNLQALVGQISGASNFFQGGVTAYSLERKVELLGVDREKAQAVDCVSEEMARQRAEGVARIYNTTVGVATTGYAEPSAATGIAQPFAYWAIFHRGANASGPTIRSGKIDAPGEGRVDAQRRIAEAVLGELTAFLRQART
jgi:nicotinamide-nucleotide amidase